MVRDLEELVGFTGQPMPAALSGLTWQLDLERRLLASGDRLANLSPTEAGQ